MSAAAIIRQMEQLPTGELRKVETWLREERLAAFDQMCAMFDRPSFGGRLSEEEIIACSLREKSR